MIEESNYYEVIESKSQLNIIKYQDFYIKSRDINSINPQLLTFLPLLINIIILEYRPKKLLLFDNILSFYILVKVINIKLLYILKN